MTLWAEPERLHVQDMEQLLEHDCHQKLNEHSTTSGLRVAKKCTRVYITLVKAHMHNTG